MIIACNSCSAQYSVPDAKVRGKLVRITCKHCAASIIVDARQMSAEAEVKSSAPSHASLERAAAEAAAPLGNGLDSLPSLADHGFGSELSVHEEKTVVGYIPREALEAERALAQKTQPPPEGSAASDAFRTSSPSLAPRSALPEQPESPDDETRRASPRAFGLSQPPPAPVPAAPSPPVSAAPKPTTPVPVPMPVPVVPRSAAPAPTVRDEPTMVSADLRSPLPKAANRGGRGGWLVFVAVLLFGVVVLFVLSQRQR